MGSSNSKPKKNGLSQLFKILPSEIVANIASFLTVGVKFTNQGEIICISLAEGVGEYGAIDAVGGHGVKINNEVITCIPRLVTLQTKFISSVEKSTDLRGLKNLSLGFRDEFPPYFSELLNTTKNSLEELSICNVGAWSTRPLETFITKNFTQTLCEFVSQAKKLKKLSLHMLCATCPLRSKSVEVLELTYGHIHEDVNIQNVIKEMKALKEVRVIGNKSRNITTMKEILNYHLEYQNKEFSKVPIRYCYNDKYKGRPFLHILTRKESKRFKGKPRAIVTRTVIVNNLDIQCLLQPRVKVISKNIVLEYNPNNDHLSIPQYLHLLGSIGITKLLLIAGSNSTTGYFPDIVRSCPNVEKFSFSIFCHPDRLDNIYEVLSSRFISSLNLTSSNLFVILDMISRFVPTKKLKMRYDASMYGNLSLDSLILISDAIISNDIFIDNIIISAVYEKESIFPAECIPKLMELCNNLTIIMDCRRVLYRDKEWIAYYDHIPFEIDQLSIPCEYTIHERQDHTTSICKNIVEVNVSRVL